MHYFIDGYNLLFKIHTTGKDLEAERNRIIKYLHTRAKLLNLHVTLVFDATHQHGESTRSHLYPMEILYTRKGETADECILEEIQDLKNIRQAVVVTCDKKLAWHSRVLGARTHTIDTFLSEVNKRVKNLLRKQAAREKPLKKFSPPPKKPSNLPSSEDPFAYYLEAFEKNYEKLENQEGKKTEKIKEKFHISDTERWLKIFLQHLDSEDFSA